MSVFKGKKILIVEDDHLLREVIIDAFERYDVELYEASNGADALKIASTHHPDIILSDLRMAGGSGLNFIKSLKELPGPIPMIYVCSGYNHLTPEEATQLNIRKVIEKPFSGRELTEIIVKNLLEAET